jgi:hypothetical protein
MEVETGAGPAFDSTRDARSPTLRPAWRLPPQEHQKIGRPHYGIPLSRLGSVSHHSAR